MEKFHDIPEHGLVGRAYDVLAGHGRKLYDLIGLNMDLVLIAPTVEYSRASPHPMHVVLRAQLLWLKHPHW